jgi:hypothetical protein
MDPMAVWILADSVSLMIILLSPIWWIGRNP